MIILAFYPLFPRFYDANVCLLRDGEILFAFEEERLLRNQHAYTGPGDPVRSLFGALAKYKLHPAEVNLWAACVALKDQVRPWELFFARTGLVKLLNGAQVATVRHHQAHVAASVLTAPFDQCLYLSLDGGGDDEFARIGVFNGHEFKDIHTSRSEHIANFYSFITQAIGFTEFEEGKIMGLAGYGKVDESLYRKFRGILSLAPDGLSVLFNRGAYELSIGVQYANYEWSNFRQHKVQVPRYRFPSLPEMATMNKADIAATLQKLTEELTLEITVNAIKMTGQRNLCLAGGLFDNASLNQRIRELPEVEVVHLPMAVGDAGLSLGAALFTYWTNSGKRCVQRPLSPFLGPEFGDDEIEAALQAYGIAYERATDVPQRAARHIAEGKIVGWFQGRGEYGPRALGNRSVLADPRDMSSKVRVHQKLKQRDEFMPYAASILEAYKDDYLIKATSSPYMGMAFEVSPARRAEIPGAVHVDGTCHPQTVNKEWSPAFHALVSEFHQLTGVPLVLNTNFNQHGEAMVATPQHAIEHLLRGAVDVLLIGNFEVHRRLVEQAEMEVRMVPESEHVRALEIEPALPARRRDEFCRHEQPAGFAPEHLHP